MTLNEWPAPVSVEAMDGDWDWEAATAAVGRSLNPRPSSSIHDMFAALDPGTGDVVLDIGGRAGGDGLSMAERFGCRVVSVDPSLANIADGKIATAAHDFGHLVDVVQGTIEQIPADDGAFDFVFSRDTFAHIEDADVALTECARVLAPNGRLFIHQVFATDLLEPNEAEQVAGHTAAVPERFSVEGFEAAARSAGFVVESVEVPGSEWYEASQEAGSAPNYLLQVSRLRRAKDALVEELGETAYRVVYGNALWSINQLLGKLESRVYVLRPIMADVSSAGVASGEPLQTRWTKRSGWYDHELELEAHRLVYRQWFDHGKDPNRFDVPIHEFIAGRLHDEIRVVYGSDVLAEVVATVDRLTSGGPGVAEPPQW